MPQTEKDRKEYIRGIISKEFEYMSLGDSIIPMKKCKYHFNEVMDNFIEEHRNDFDMVGTYYYNEEKYRYIYRIRTTCGGPVSEFLTLLDLMAINAVEQTLENDCIVFERARMIDLHEKSLDA